MVKTKSVQRTVRNRVKKSILTFLDKDRFLEKPQTLNWVISIIRDHKYGTVDRETLTSILDEVKDYGDKARFIELQAKCKELGLI